MENCRRMRHGAAEIEFVMVLPIVLFLLLLLLWAGAVATRNAEVAVRARHDAWRLRPQAVHGPFDFGDTAGGQVAATADATVHVSPAVDNAFVPRSTQVVYGCAWNHPAVDMDHTPNWRLQALALRGTAGNIVSEIGSVLSNVSALPAAIENVIKDTVMQELANASPILGTILSMFQNAGTDLAAAKQRAKQEELARIGIQAAAAKARLEEEKNRVTALEMRIRETEQALADAGSEERSRLQEQLRTLRREAQESRKRQEPLVETLRLLEEQRGLTEAQ